MIEIIENKKTGFEDAVIFGAWKVAYITHSEQYGEPSLLKRHTKTDEVLVLLKGNATIFTYDDGVLSETKMESGKLYNIKQSTWHHVKVPTDAMLLAMENSDTTVDNTERMILSADKGTN